MDPMNQCPTRDYYINCSECLLECKLRMEQCVNTQNSDNENKYEPLEIY